MTAAALITRNIARRQRGRCSLRSDVTILAKDGEVHADCSTCHSVCGDPDDFGLAAPGIRLKRDGADGQALAWSCPGCGSEVVEPTSALRSHIDAAVVATDPLCHRCRKARHA